MMHDTAVRSLLLLLCLVFPAFGQQDSGVERFPRWLVSDPPSIVRSLQGRDLLLAGGTILFLIPLSRADDPLHQFVERRKGFKGSPLLRATNHFGGVWGVAGSVVLLGGTLLTNDLYLQNTAFSSVQAAAYAGATALLLKWATGRSRPSEEKGALHFRPGRTFHDAFPSGHTAVAFALGIPWVRAYPSSPSWLLLIVAAGTGAARIAFDRHWLTDVVGGAVLGAGMGCLVSRRRMTAN